MKILYLVPILGFLAGGFGSTAAAELTLAPNLPAASGPRAATKLFYVMADNNLAAEQHKTLTALKKAGSFAPTAHSLILYDRPTRATTLYQVPDAGGSLPSSALGPGIGNVQTTDPEVMSRIVQWVFARYPGRQRFLHVSSHGKGVWGIGADHVAGARARQRRALMPVQQFAMALRSALGPTPLDLVFFDACHMANIDALYEMTSVAHHAVASRFPIEANERDVVEVPIAFEQLVRKGMTPLAVAEGLIAAATPEAFQSRPGYFALVDVAALRAVISALDALGGQLTSLPAAAIADIARAIAEIPERDGMVGPSLLTKTLRAQTKDAALQRALDAVDQAIARAVKSRSVGDLGLTLFLPFDKDDAAFAGKDYRLLRIARDAPKWAGFIDKLLDLRKTNARPR